MSMTIVPPSTVHGITNPYTSLATRPAMLHIWAEDPRKLSNGRVDRDGLILLLLKTELDVSAPMHLDRRAARELRQRLTEQMAALGWEDD